MKKRFLAATAVAGVLLVQTLGFGSAGALVTTYTGTLDGTDPTLDVPIISTPVCTGSLSGFQVAYDVIPFLDPEPGTHTFVLSAVPDGNAVAVILYEGSFDPLDPLDSCVAASNTGANPTVTYDFLADTPYYFVIVDDTFAQDGADWSVEVTSPDPPPPSTESTTTTTTEPPTTSSTAAEPQATAAPAASTRPTFTG